MKMSEKKLISPFIAYRLSGYLSIYLIPRPHSSKSHKLGTLHHQKHLSTRLTYEVGKWFHMFVKRPEIRVQILYQVDFPPRSAELLGLDGHNQG